MKYAIAFLLMMTSIGCATTANRLNKISIGMTKPEVIDLLGDPVSVSATNSVEYLNYQFTETRNDIIYKREHPYFVRIVSGKVESYGKLGDFNSTKDNTIKIETTTK